MAKCVLNQRQNPTSPTVAVDHPNQQRLDRLTMFGWQVAKGLGQIEKAESISYLRKALSHEEIRVRKEALKALASIKTEQAIDLVCECIEDDEISICKSAIEWSAAMEAEQAVPILKRLLSGRSLWKKDEETIRLAIEALGSIGSESATDLLRELGRARNLLRHKRSVLIRKTAAAALHCIEGKQHS